MPADLAQLEAALRRAGLSVTPLGQPSAPAAHGVVFVAYASGPPLGGRQALVRATDDVCRLLVWLDLPPTMTPSDRSALDDRLLDFNFKSPFGRASKLFSDEDASLAQAVFVETGFFWHYAASAPDLLDVEIGRRIEGFTSLAEQVVKQVERFSHPGRS